VGSGDAKDYCGAESGLPLDRHLISFSSVNKIASKIPIPAATSIAFARNALPSFLFN
jgi:hypothetical protein